MGRNRKGKQGGKGRNHWDDLRGVYRKRNKLIYREYQGRVNGKSQFGPDIHLCQVDDPPSKLHSAYERLMMRERDSVQWLLEQYHNSPRS